MAGTSKTLSTRPVDIIRDISTDEIIGVIPQSTDTVISSSTANIISTYAEISSVAAASLTTIVSYTAPVGKVTFLQRASAGGDNIATYQVEINTVNRRKEEHISDLL